MLLDGGRLTLRPRKKGLSGVRAIKDKRSLLGGELPVMCEQMVSPQRLNSHWPTISISD